MPETHGSITDDFLNGLLGGAQALEQLGQSLQQIAEAKASEAGILLQGMDFSGLASFVQSAPGPGASLGVHSTQHKVQPGPTRGEECRRFEKASSPALHDVSWTCFELRPSLHPWLPEMLKPTQKLQRSIMLLASTALCTQWLN